MPKMKTKRAAAKRLKRTATGKLMARQGWKRHLLEAKPPKRRRRLRKARVLPLVEARRLRVLVPYI